MNYIYILFLFVFMLSACHSSKEISTQAAYVQEVARSDITISDVETSLNNLVNRNIVITLEDVVVEYPALDSSKSSDDQHPKIRSPGTPASLSIGQITISDNTEESTNMRVYDNSLSTSDMDSNLSADVQQHNKEEASNLKPSNGSVFFLIFSIIFCIALIIYCKGKLKL